MQAPGKEVRLSRLFRSASGRAVLVPVDDSLLAGPEVGLRSLRDLLAQLNSGGADMVMGFPGLLRIQRPGLCGLGTIVNVTASTIRSTHTRKVQTSTVEHAVQLGADAVAVHVNVCSTYEGDMLKTLGRVAEECDRFGLPLMAIMYPRREAADGDENFESLKEADRPQYAQLVRHAVRIGVELGADIIKTQFTGDVESFRSVVESSMGCPVLTAGGPLIPAETMLTNAQMAVEAGAAGVSFGRNVYQRRERLEAVKALVDVVKGGLSAAEALERHPLQ